MQMWLQIVSDFNTEESLNNMQWGLIKIESNILDVTIQQNDKK